MRKRDFPRALFACLLSFFAATRVLAAGSITLDWLPPAENVDHSVLSNLAGYHLYAYREGVFFPLAVDLKNPGLSAYTFDGLASGRWIFYATAVNTAGVESDPSNLIYKTVP
jgi:hypothetical protein